MIELAAVERRAGDERLSGPCWAALWNAYGDGGPVPESPTVRAFAAALQEEYARWQMLAFELTTG